MYSILFRTEQWTDRPWVQLPHSHTTSERSIRYWTDSHMRADRKKGTMDGQSSICLSVFISRSPQKSLDSPTLRSQKFGKNLIKKNPVKILMRGIMRSARSPWIRLCWETNWLFLYKVPINSLHWTQFENWTQYRGQSVLVRIKCGSPHRNSSMREHGNYIRW